MKIFCAMRQKTLASPCLAISENLVPPVTIGLKPCYYKVVWACVKAEFCLQSPQCSGAHYIKFQCLKYSLEIFSDEELASELFCTYSGKVVWCFSNLSSFSFDSWQHIFRGNSETGQRLNRFPSWAVCLFWDFGLLCSVQFSVVSLRSWLFVTKEVILIVFQESIYAVLWF